MNATTFYNKVENFSKTQKNRDLEEYLLALYSEISSNKNKKITYKLVFSILENAFTSKPITFNNDWLNCNEPPDSNRINNKFTNPKFSDFVDKTNTSTLSPYEFTIETLKFQIADLHKMKGKQLVDEYRYFGIDSETGHRWYNFDPFGNLSCGARCMEDNDIFLEEIDWSFIGELLENGRIYE